MASMILISGGCFHKGNKAIIMPFFLFLSPCNSNQVLKHTKSKKAYLLLFYSNLLGDGA